MLNVLTYQIDGATYQYVEKQNEISIVGYEGKRGELHIPSAIEGKSVTEIEKKAFFNCSTVYRIFVPSSVTKIGDWAFSHCKDLEEVFLKKKAYEFGRAVFLECNELKRICVLDMDEDDVPKEAEILGFGSLLAATCGILDAQYLFQTDIKDETDWLSLWDAKMFSILREDDMEGYTQVLLCGEEDYGSKENNLSFFLTEKRKRKVRLAFLRLLYHNKLNKNDEEELKKYLLNHTCGCESDEAWQVLKEEHADDAEYVSLFLNTGCVTLQNYDAMLLDLSADHPQLKAYLMRYKEEKLGGADFFAGLDLDL